MVGFLTWAGRRLIGLIFHGIGLLSLALGVVLFFLPSATSGVSRWWAVAPIIGYVIYALLGDEYRRVNTPCLTAQTVPPARDDKHRSYSLEIRNCGEVPIRQLEWELHHEGWYTATDHIEYPIAELEPGNSRFFYLSKTYVAPNEVRITLKAVANGTPLEVEKLLSI